MKILIIGTTGSGKSTLASKISKKLDIKHIEQDNLFWQPNWQIAPKEEFIAKMMNEIKSDSWVTCGNHGAVRETLIKEADTIIWLDYSFHIVLYRILKRSIIRAAFKQKCCNGNVETFRQTFFSGNSILLWLFKTYAKRRKDYTLLFNELEKSDKKLIRLKNLKEAESFLKNLQ